MKVYQTNEIKNIALLGNDGSGKTTLTESLLFERKPLGELFIKPKRPMNDSDSDQLNLWGNFFGQ